jgi:DNA-binding MarR family transcriptional regulator
METSIACQIRMGLDDISSQLRRKYSESLRELNLYVGQDNLLHRLWAGDGITQMQLSEYLKCEPPTISNTVKSLEQNGFIYRQRDELDGRVMRIFLTEKGKEVEQAVTLKWQEHQELLLKSVSEEEQLLLNDLIKRMKKNLA